MATELSKQEIYVSPSKNSYTIYTKTGCSYCEKTKEMLKDIENIKIINCDDYLINDKENFLSWVEAQTGGIKYRTFPIIFLNGKFIGGFTETKKQFEMNEAFAGNLDF